MYTRRKTANVPPSRSNFFTCKRSALRPQERAQAALRTLAGAWRYHAVAATELLEHKRYGGKGRPRAETAVQATLWQMRAAVCPDVEAIQRDKHQKGCFVLGTNIAAMT